MVATGRLADGADQARLFARRFPGSSDAQNLLGDALLAHGETGAAIAAYREAALVRTDWPLMKRLIAAYQRGGAQKAARASLRAYLEGGAREPMAAALYGEWLARSGRDPSVLTLRSEIAARAGHDEAASEFAWRAYSLQPMYAPAIRAVVATTRDDAVRQRLQTKLARLR